MRKFVAKDGPSREPVRGKTITDAEWQALRDRQKGQPSRGFKEAGRRMQHDEQNYRKRHQN